MLLNALKTLSELANHELPLEDLRAAAEANVNAAVDNAMKEGGDAAEQAAVGLQTVTRNKIRVLQAVLNRTGKTIGLVRVKARDAVSEAGEQLDDYVEEGKAAAGEAADEVVERLTAVADVLKIDGEAAGVTQALFGEITASLSTMSPDDDAEGFLGFNANGTLDEPKITAIAAVAEITPDMVVDTDTGEFLRAERDITGG